REPSASPSSKWRRASRGGSAAGTPGDDTAPGRSMTYLPGILSDNQTRSRLQIDSTFTNKLVSNLFDARAVGFSRASSTFRPCPDAAFATPDCPNSHRCNLALPTSTVLPRGPVSTILPRGPVRSILTNCHLASNLPGVVVDSKHGSNFSSNRDKVWGR